MKFILTLFDNVVIFFICVIGIIVEILHFFGQFEHPINFPLFIFLLLCLLGLHQVKSDGEKHEILKRSEHLLEKVSNSLNEFQFEEFEDSMSIETKLGNNIIGARKSICDLSWKSRISEGFSTGDRQKTHSFLEDCISSASVNILYREIFVFNDPRRIQKLNRRIEENKQGYSCGYFPDDAIIPRLQFVIVDDEEVFFFASSGNSILCSFRNKNLAKVFLSYFEVLWEKSIKLKNGPNVNYSEIMKVRGLFPKAT